MPRLAFDIEARLAAFEAGLAKINQATTQMAGRLEGAFAGVQSTFAALSGVIAGGAIATLVRNFADAGDQLAKLSSKTTIAVESLSELQYAAKLSDVSNEELEKGLTKLRLEIEQAAAGSKEARQAFQALGLTQQDIAQLSVDQVFARLADAFAEGKANAADLAKVLGDRNWATFAPLLSGGSAALREMAAEARRTGVVISTDTAKAAEAFNDNLTRLSESLRGFGQQLAGPVLSGLSQMVQGMVDATRQGGLLLGVLRGLGEAGKIALQGGVDGDAIAKQRAYILEIRGEIAKLQDSMSGNGALGTGFIDRLIYGDAQSKRNKLAELKITLADAQKALANLQQAAQAPAPSAGPARTVTPLDVKKTRASDALTESERAALAVQMANDAAFENFLDDVARRRGEIAEDFKRRFEEGQQIDAKVVAEQNQALERLFAGTDSGKRKAITGDLDVLNEALIAGKISAEQYDEAFALIEKRFEEVGKSGQDNVGKMTKDAEDGFKRLQAAVENWGDATAEAITQMVKKGKLDFGSLVETILTDLVRLTVQQTITRPIFTALANSLGGLNLFGGSTPSPAGTPFGFKFGGGRATGGSVSGGTTYLVGERGLELFTAPSNGAIVPNGAFGGVTYQQTVVINAPTDGATVRAAVLQGAALARAEMGRMARVGALS